MYSFIAKVGLLMYTIDTPEIIIKCLKQTKTLYLKYYLTHDERRQLISETSDSACLLFEYYLRVASYTKPVPLDDVTSAEYFGWLPTKVRRIRTQLVHNNWFRHTKGRLNNGQRVDMYYLGKDAVEATMITGKFPGGALEHLKAPADIEDVLDSLDAVTH